MGRAARDRAREVPEARARAAAKLLASRPDFDHVEKLFACKLPPHLREAWHAHYEGSTVGFGFIAADKDKLNKLVSLARKLEETLEDAARGHQLLPFAIGEHDGDYYALDLSQPTGDDFSVRVFFNKGDGGSELVFPNSAAWLEADGIS